MVAVAFKLQDNVHHVFQHFGAGEVAVFGDVSHEDDGHVAGFGVAQEFGSGFTNLGNGASGRIQLRVVGRLDGVDDENIGLKVFGRLKDFRGGNL